jgi:glycosyltransferase involved in cell wall biosynthesis
VLAPDRAALRSPDAEGAAEECARVSPRWDRSAWSARAAIVPAAERPLEVAMLAYFFPPVGGGGTPRSTKFVKHLSSFGVTPTVFTVRPDPRGYGREFRIDEASLEELAGVPHRVVRVEDPGPPGPLRRLRGGRAWPYAWAAAYPWLWEPQLAWCRACVRAGLRAARAVRFRVVYASAAPFGALPAARDLARRLRIPWVADLRDLWTRDPLKLFPTRAHHLWESSLERRVLSSASAILANTPTSGDRLRRWLPHRARSRVHVVPNGWDEADVAPLRAASPRASRPEVLLLYTGTLYAPRTDRGRLGRYRPHPLDEEARSLLPLARGLRRLRETDPAIADAVRVRAVGYSPPALAAAIRDLGLADRFEFVEPVSRREAVGEMGDADALIVVQVAYEDPRRPVPNVPGKVYEYVASGLPLLAPLVAGDTRDLLRQVPGATVCDPRDPDDVARGLARLVRRLRDGPVRTPPPAWFEGYSRRMLARDLATVFRSVAGPSA